MSSRSGNCSQEGGGGYWQGELLIELTWNQELGHEKEQDQEQEQEQHKSNSKSKSKSKGKSKRQTSTCFAVSKYLSPGQYPYSASSASEGPSSCFPRELLLH